MADETDELLLDEPVEDEVEDAAPAEADEGEPGISIEIEGEEPLGAGESDLVRHLRAQLRDANQAKHKDVQAQQHVAKEIGPKPRLADFDYDEDRWEEARDAWDRDKLAAERVQQAGTDEQQRQSREFAEIRSRHTKRAIALGIADIDEAEKTVAAALGSEKTGMLMVAADDSAKLLSALHRNPLALARIADEPNPLLQLKMAIKLEEKIKVVDKRKPPAPEADTIQRGTAALSVSSDKHLEKLEKDALRTGNRSALIAYKAGKRK